LFRAGAPYHGSAMLGTILNSAGILLGGLIGLFRLKPLSPAMEGHLRNLLGAFTAFYGLRLFFLSLSGPFLALLKQLVILILALTLGRLIGRALRLQKMSNRIGQRARESIAAARPGAPGRVGEGFRTCAALFCAAPLSMLGAIQEGLAQYPYPLAIKAVIDGLATLGFVPLFGWGVLLAAIPVLAFQGTLTLLCSQWIGPWLQAHDLVPAVNAVGGVLVTCVALLLLGLKRLELTDYLPAVAVAPLIAWLWR
jgi:uncharacterized protein